jgi:glycerol-3-phosphate acyltransferase PlsY
MMISPCPLLGFAIMPQSSMMGRARSQPLEARPPARNISPMETPRPPILDMTPEGQFNTPPPPGRLDRVMGGVLRVSLVIAAVAGALLLASLALVAIAAFLRHLFPVFFQFKGGTGVATALGVLRGISGWLGLLVLLTWLAVAVISRYSSLSALIASIAAPVYYVLLDGSLWAAEKPLLAAIIAMSALLLWRHAQNIGRLLKGQESKIGSKKDKAATAPAAPASKSKRYRASNKKLCDVEE